MSIKVGDFVKVVDVSPSLFDEDGFIDFQICFEDYVNQEYKVLKIEDEDNSVLLKTPGEMYPETWFPIACVSSVEPRAFKEGETVLIVGTYLLGKKGRITKDYGEYGQGRYWDVQVFDTMREYTIQTEDLRKNVLYTGDIVKILEPNLRAGETGVIKGRCGDRDYYVDVDGFDSDSAILMENLLLIKPVKVIDDFHKAMDQAVTKAVLDTVNDPFSPENYWK